MFGLGQNFSFLPIFRISVLFLGKLKDLFFKLNTSTLTCLFKGTIERERDLLHQIKVQYMSDAFSLALIMNKVDAPCCKYL
jgi:hypothetical protein